MAAGSWQLIWVAGGGGSGQITLASLPQTGAATGQAIVWNGSSWAPGTISGSGGGTLNSLSGDVSTGTVDGSGNAVATLNKVGTFTTSQANSLLAQVGTAGSTNVAGAIVARDNSGNFSAGTITASLNGNATSATTATTAGSATSYTGSVSLSQLAQGGATSAQVIAWNGSAWAPATVSSGTSGITQLTGDVTTASGSGSQAATVAQVGGKSATAVASAVTTVAGATSAATASTLAMRDSSGNLAANTFTGALSGNATSATTATTATTATNYTGSVALSQLAQNGATANQVISWSGSAWAPATVASGSSGITQLTGDVTTPANSSGSTAATIVSLGGQTASYIAYGAGVGSNATVNPTASTAVMRDSYGAFAKSTGLVNFNSSATATANQSGYTLYVTTGSPTITLPTNPTNVSYKYYILANGSTVTLTPPSGGSFVYFSNSTTNSINTVNSFTAASMELTGVPGSGNYIITNEHGNWNNAGSPLNVYSALSYPSTSGYVLTATGSSGGAAFAAPAAGGSSAPVFAASIASPPATATGTIYVATTTTTSTLPLSPSTATQFTFLNGSGGTQTIAQGAGAQIYVGNTATTSGTGGNIVLNGQGSSITIVCQASSNTWYKIAGSGQVTPT